MKFVCKKCGGTVIRSKSAPKHLPNDLCSGCATGSTVRLAEGQT